METQRLRAKDQAKVEAMHQRFRYYCYVLQCCIAATAPCYSYVVTTYITYSATSTNSSSTAWTRQEFRLKEKMAEIKEEAGVGRLADRLSEREFQLSRLHRDIALKKQVQ